MEDLEMVASKSPIVIDAAQTGVDGVAASVVEIWLFLGLFKEWLMMTNFCGNCALILLTVRSFL